MQLIDKTCIQIGIQLANSKMRVYILMRIHEITWPYVSLRFTEIKSARRLNATAVYLLIPPKMEKIRE